MKTKLIMICLTVGLIGCTSPTQRFAERSLQLGVTQQHSVYYDMSRIARQEILNNGAAAVVVAADNQDATAAQAVVKDVFDKMGDVDKLNIQWERARALVRIGQQFVWSQQGILDIMKKEFDTASKRAKGK